VKPGIWGAPASHKGSPRPGSTRLHLTFPSPRARPETSPHHARPGRIRNDRNPAVRPRRAREHGKVALWQMQERALHRPRGPAPPSPGEDGAATVTGPVGGESQGGGRRGSPRGQEAPWRLPGRAAHRKPLQRSPRSSSAHPHRADRERGRAGAPPWRCRPTSSRRCRSGPRIGGTHQLGVPFATAGLVPVDTLRRTAASGACEGPRATSARGPSVPDEEAVEPPACGQRQCVGADRVAIVTPGPQDRGAGHARRTGERGTVGSPRSCVDSPPPDPPPAHRRDAASRLGPHLQCTPGPRASAPQGRPSGPSTPQSSCVAWCSRASHASRHSRRVMRPSRSEVRRARTSPISTSAAVGPSRSVSCTACRLIPVQRRPGLQVTRRARTVPTGPALTDSDSCVTFRAIRRCKGMTLASWISSGAASARQLPLSTRTGFPGADGTEPVYLALAAQWRREGRAVPGEPDQRWLDLSTRTIWW
jgi:hypothetical protein